MSKLYLLRSAVIKIADMADEKTEQKKKSGSSIVPLLIVFGMIAVGLSFAFMHHINIGTTITAFSHEQEPLEPSMAETDIKPAAEPKAENTNNNAAIEAEISSLKEDVAALKASIQSMAPAQDDTALYRMQALWRLENRVRQGLSYTSELSAFQKLMQSAISADDSNLLQLDANTGSLTGTMLQSQLADIEQQLLALVNGRPKWFSRFFSIRPVSEKTASSEVEKAFFRIERLLGVESYNAALADANTVKAILEPYQADSAYGDYIAWLARLERVAKIWQALDNIQQSLLQEKS